MISIERTGDTEDCQLLRKTLDGDGDQLLAEAEGLSALSASKTVSIPAVHTARRQELLMQWISHGQSSETGWQQLGCQLASLHEPPQACFGFSCDTYCGPTLQPNPATLDGYEFFSQQRLLCQGQMARDNGLLTANDARAMERLAQRLPELVPSQPPALLHGDLWRGNVVFDEEGLPWLIDPACYWGWPEADLAMTTLFGGFSEGFYGAYCDSRSLDSGWRERLPIYNLYHLLNHLNIFGDSYLGQYREVMASFS